MPINKEAKPSPFDHSAYQMWIRDVNALDPLVFLECLTGFFFGRSDGGGREAAAALPLPAFSMLLLDEPICVNVERFVTPNEAYKFSLVNTEFMLRFGFVGCKSCSQACVPIGVSWAMNCKASWIARPAGPKAKYTARALYEEREVGGTMSGEASFFGGWYCVHPSKASTWKDVHECSMHPKETRAHSCWEKESEREADHNDYLESLANHGRMQDVQALMQAFDQHYADQPEVTDAYVNDDPPYVTVVEPSGREVVLVLDD